MRTSSPITPTWRQPGGGFLVNIMEIEKTLESIEKEAIAIHQEMKDLEDKVHDLIAKAQKARFEYKAKRFCEKEKDRYV